MIAGRHVPCEKVGPAKQLSSSNQVETWPILAGLVFPPHVMVRATNTSPPVWLGKRARAAPKIPRQKKPLEKPKPRDPSTTLPPPSTPSAARSATGGRPSAPAAWTPWMRWSSCAKACARRVVGAMAMADLGALAPKRFRFSFGCGLGCPVGWKGKKRRNTTKQALCQVSHSLSSWTLLMFVDHVSSIQKVFTFVWPIHSTGHDTFQRRVDFFGTKK